MCIFACNILIILTAYSYSICMISFFISVWILTIYKIILLFSCFHPYVFHIEFGPSVLSCWFSSNIFWQLLLGLPLNLTYFFFICFSVDPLSGHHRLFPVIMGEEWKITPGKVYKHLSEGHGDPADLLSPPFKAFSFLSSLIIHIYCYSLIAKSSAIWFLMGDGDVTCIATSNIPQLII